jgi:hypothetical protein
MMVSSVLFLIVGAPLLWALSVLWRCGLHTTYGPDWRRK